MSNNRCRPGAGHDPTADVLFGILNSVLWPRFLLAACSWFAFCRIFELMKNAPGVSKSRWAVSFDTVLRRLGAAFQPLALLG